MIYVCLLRGINVGGNSKVEMPRLKTLFENLGLQDVATYINSGNVIFQDGRSKDELEKLIEKEIKEKFGFEVRVVLRSFKDIESICNKVPDSWANDDEQKTDVLFLWDEINNAGIMDKIVINPKLENVLYAGGALVWNIGRENVTKGGGVKLIKTDFYKHMTARNINTVRKLYDMMSKISET